MKKIRKIFIALCVGLGLMLATPQRASAQGMPTIDFSAILTNIFQYLQDYLFENGGEISKTLSSVEQYKEIYEKFEEVREVIKVLSTLNDFAKNIKEIVNIAEDIAQRVEKMNVMAQYMSRSSFTSGMSGLSIVHEFSTVTMDCIEAIKPILNALFDSKRGDGPNLLQVIRNTIRDFAQQIYLTVSQYEYAMYKAYSRCRLAEAANQNVIDANIFIY